MAFTAVGRFNFITAQGLHPFKKSLSHCLLCRGSAWTSGQQDVGHEGVVLAT